MKTTCARKLTLALWALLSLVSVVEATEPNSAALHAITRWRPQPSTEPVRLPPVDARLHWGADGIEPFAFTPIARFELIDVQAPPALSLGVGMPGDTKPSIGGWISFGYPGRGLGQ